MFQNSLYAAFDLHPSAKGASTHISYFSKALASVSEQTVIATIGTDKMPKEEHEETITYLRFNEVIPNYLHRAEEYGNWLLSEVIAKHQFDLCHFRDIWSGLAILQEKRKYRTVFELNGLPSVELPFRYPSITDQTLAKIQSIEAFCLKEADAIVVPSDVIKQNLLLSGADEKKITTITNGAVVPESFEKPDDAPESYIIYFGAAQLWQGVDDLLRAFALLRDYEGLKLIICSSTAQKYTKGFAKMADKLGIGANVIWKYQLPQSELYAYLQHALFSVAPLKDCSRNVAQGCSPLKVFESMANRTAVVASDLPVIREIGDEPVLRFARPDRPADLARSMRMFIEYPQLIAEQKENAFEHLKTNFQWKQKQTELKNLYSELK